MCRFNYMYCNFSLGPKLEIVLVSLCCRSRLVISNRSFWTKRGKVTSPRLRTLRLLRSQLLYLQIKHQLIINCIKNSFKVHVIYILKTLMFLFLFVQKVKVHREKYTESTRPRSRHEDATFHPAEVSHEHIHTFIWIRRSYDGCRTTETCSMFCKNCRDFLSLSCRL